MRVAALLLAACWAGCWQDPPPARPDPPPPPPQTATLPPRRSQPATCSATIAHIYDVLASAHDASPDALEPKFRDALVGTCEDMQWSDEVRSCIASGQTEHEIEDCRDRMTQEQIEDIKRVLEGTP
ncbi:MAG TPA: hypothetical protein VGG74_11500 [Kofleriaceae bacterium]|jgi:hypothetical protein